MRRNVTKNHHSNLKLNLKKVKDKKNANSMLISFRQPSIYYFSTLITTFQLGTKGGCNEFHNLLFHKTFAH